MTARKFTISVPAEVDAALRNAAEADGVAVSTWIARVAQEAVVRRARIAEGMAAVREFEADHGALTQEERDVARRELAELGVLPGETRRRAG
jgi:recombinational DNA repair protein RecR